MANPEHLAILNQGVEAWNEWRNENLETKPDLSGAMLSGANLSRANLSNADFREAMLCTVNLIKANLSRANLSEADLGGAHFREANLRAANLSEASLFDANLNDANLSNANLREAHVGGANLSNAILICADLTQADLTGANLRKANLRQACIMEANLWKADLSEADLSEANLRKANLFEANIREANLGKADLGQADLLGADLRKAILSRADLSEANLTAADLSGANLKGADLSSSILVETNFDGATLTGCQIYGISAWDVNLENTEQNGLIITQKDQPVITVDNVEVAQFVYMLIAHKKIRNIINTMTGKAVLILGRFGEKKVILDSIAEELRARDYLPITFDFDRPLDKNLTETVITLAGLCKFVIAVMSDPQSVPWEVASIKQVFKIPIIPLCQEGQGVFSMYNDEKINPWYLSPIPFKDIDHIKQMMDSKILEPAEKKHLELRELKAK